jgi:hypothetical protein
MIYEDDVRDILGAVRVPTMILHREQDSPETNQYLAEHIHGSEYVAVPGSEHLPYIGDQDTITAALEWKHVDLDAGTVELPGVKTDLAWRTVHLTSRGIQAITSMPRALATRHVFNVDSRPISFNYFRREVWHPALGLAGLETRPPYSLRHSYALHSLQAGVPIATLARQMGHADVSRTFKVYGGWVREMGAYAAALRESWARDANMEQAHRNPANGVDIRVPLPAFAHRNAVGGPPVGSQRRRSERLSNG